MIAVEVESARVSRAFLDLVRRLRTDLRGAWEQIGARMVANTVPVVPVESAALVNSLKAEANAEGVDVTAGSSSVVYAGVQNFGWPARNITGTRFMDRAEDTAESDAPDELASAIQTLINRVGLN